MNIQEKKRILKRYKQIEKYLEALLEVRCGLYSVSASRLTGMPHAANQNVDRLAEAICQADLREKKFFDEQYDSAEKEKEKIFWAIDKLHNVEEKQILVLRYISGMSWHEIEKKVGYEESQVFRLHRRALSNIVLS